MHCEAQIAVWMLTDAPRRYFWTPAQRLLLYIWRKRSVRHNWASA